MVRVRIQGSIWGNIWKDNYTTDAPIDSGSGGEGWTLGGSHGLGYGDTLASLPITGTY